MQFGSQPLLDNLVLPRKLGVVSGEQGTYRVLPGLVRIPDVGYVSWARFPNGELPEEPIPLLVPDLAFEVLSAGNTSAEMERKRHEYFTAGVRQIWIVDRRQLTVQVYTAVDQFTVFGIADTISGGEILPGFSVSVSDLFGDYR